jgi:hypothetical protein
MARFMTKVADYAACRAGWPLAGKALDILFVIPVWAGMAGGWLPACPGARQVKICCFK